MRRLFLPVLLLIAAIAATMQMNNANEASDPGRATATTDDPSLETPIFSARRAPEWLRSPKSDSLLTDAVGSVLAASDRPELACVIVERDGEQLAGSSTQTAIRSAELHRLITATVIDAAGSGSGFRTEIAYSSTAEIVPVDEELGTFKLVGDIWIIGGGDPGLASEAYVSRFGDDRSYTSWDDLAADAISALVALDIVEIDGRIIGDETKYSPNERDYYRDTVEIAGESFDVWSVENNTVGPMSALLVNDGFDSWPEDTADQSLNGRSSNPAVSAADTFDDLLEAAGVVVRRSPDTGEAPPLAERETLAVIDSPPLTEIIERSLIDATTAEMLLKEYGIRSGSSPERGSVIFTLATAGFTAAGLPYDVTGTIFADGSGRSAVNRTSCEMIHATIVDPDGIGAAVLRDARQSSVSLCSRPGAGDLRVFATASGATTGLAGTYVAENGERLTFTMLAEDPGRLVPAEEGAEPVGPYGFCNSLQAAMLDAITGHPYGPELDDLAPTAPASS